MGTTDKTDNVRPKGLGVRHLQTFFLFLAVLLAYTMRVNMSIAIVAMTANITGNITEIKSDYTTFDWSHSVQAVILSSFFWGYVILQIPAGALARRFGGKVPIIFSVFINSVISFFLPVAAFFGGWQLVCAGRFLQGLTQAFVYPCMHHLISQWVPLEEKGFLSTMIYAGGHLGIAMQLMLGGLVASAWGWPAIFYTNGTLGTIWTVAYLILGSASPEQSKIISKTELRYIQRSLGRVGKQKHYPVPWKEIMTCVPFWAVIVAHCGHNWCFFTLMTEMPSYMSKVLGFNLKRSGVISSLPYLAMYLLSFPMGLMTDLILAKNWLSIANTRKLFNSMEGLGIRHLQIFFLFLAMLLAYAMRVNLSIAIVAMTANVTGNITETKSDYTTFDWSHSVQAVILSSFFWGYMILQIPAGALARRFGGKVLIIFAVFVNSVISFFLPVSACFGGWQLVCAGRILQGLAQAFVYPCTHHLISQWVPLEEKGLLSTIIYAGGYLGIALQLMLGGLVASAWGWPAVFYTNGTLGIIWTAAYLIFGSASPEQSKIISKTELRYIQMSLGRIGKQKHYPIPWKKIITCVPFWAVIVAHCGYNWGFLTLMTEMPSYMSKVFGFNMKSNGVLSSLPYLVMYLLSFPMGFMTDLILKKNWLSVSNTRKLFNSIGFFGPALALIGLSYTSANNIVLAVVMLILSVGISAGRLAGFLLVHIDLAPNFSGILMSITNFLANIIAIIPPLVCGFIVNDEKDPAEWRKVFFIASGVYFFCNLFFILFSTSEKQPWNEPEPNEVEMEALNENKC